MAEKTSRIVIYPIIIGSQYFLSSDLFRNKPETPAEKPNFRDFVSFAPDLFRTHSLRIINKIYEEMYRLIFLTDWQVLNLNQILWEVSWTLAGASLWTWRLEEIIHKIMDYFATFPGLNRADINELRLEMADRIHTVFSSLGIESAEAREVIVDLILKEFESSGSQIIMEKMAGTLQQNARVRHLPPEALDRCVEEFFTLLVKKGLIFLPEE